MLFNSLGFMFVFLPLCFGLYFLLSYKANFSLAKFSLAVFSLIFYAWWDWRYLGLLLFSILFNYTSATLMLGAKKYKKLILIFALCVNIALLCYFKYMDFFIENLNWIGGLNLPLLHIVLPLGISFFTITQIAFLIDCYEGLVKEKSLSNYILFVTFFPHLIAGPILHHKQMMPQFANKENGLLNGDNIVKGIFIFSIGLFKKVIVADNFAIWANAGFMAVDSGASLNIFEAWASVLSYALQLYFDFSGYCDMAIGLGLLFNIILPVNFNSPFKACNIIDYWKRWHISLTNFITTYIYTPIVRSFDRPSFSKILLATFITFVIAGIWHGSGWNFFIFGAMHGLGLVVNHIWQKKIKLKMPKALGWICMMVWVLIAFVFFRAKSFDGAILMLKNMFGINVLALPEKAYKIPLLLNNIHMTDFGVACIIFGFIFCLVAKNSIELMNGFKACWRNVVLVAIFLASGILASAGISYSEFIYFNF